MLKSLLSTGVLLTCAALMCVAEEPPTAKPNKAELRKLLEQLKSEDFETRAQASQALSALEDVPDELRQATMSDDLEVRHRAQAAMEVITTRIEDRAFKAMAADLQRIRLDRFVRRMVRETDFADEKHWQVMLNTAQALTTRVNQLSDKKFAMPEIGGNPLAALKDAKRQDFDNKWLLLSDPGLVLHTARSCVILGIETMPPVGDLKSSLVFVDGDFEDASTVDNCVVLVHGNIGHLGRVRNSIILATGDCKGAMISENCFYQVTSPKLRFCRSFNNVFLKSFPAVPDRGVNDQRLAIDDGPLQLLRFSEADEKEVPRKVEKLLGDGIIDLLQNASRVEVFRIKPEQGKKTDEGISGYPIISTGKEKGKDFARQLTSVLLAEKTYFGESALCFTPGVAFRIWRGKDQDKDVLDVVICFQCTGLHLVMRDERKKVVAQVDGAFGPDIKALLRLAKEAFPDDAEIQAIKETK